MYHADDRSPTSTNARNSSRGVLAAAPEFVGCTHHLGNDGSTASPLEPLRPSGERRRRRVDSNGLCNNRVSTAADTCPAAHCFL
jgi:hypothetical protein